MIGFLCFGCSDPYIFGLVVDDHYYAGVASFGPLEWSNVVGGHEF